MNILTSVKASIYNSNDKDLYNNENLDFSYLIILNTIGLCPEL